MINWETIICSLVASVLVAFVTHKLAVWSEEEKLIHAERQKLYLEIVEQVDKWMNHSMVVWDHDYIQYFVNEKHRVKLIASKKTIECYEAIFIKITETYSKLVDFNKANDPNEDKSRFYIDESGELAQEHIPVEDFEWYNAKLAEFKEKNLPDPAIKMNLIRNLYDSMRKDLRSKK